MNIKHTAYIMPALAMQPTKVLNMTFTCSTNMNINYLMQKNFSDGMNLYFSVLLYYTSLITEVNL